MERRPTILEMMPRSAWLLGAVALATVLSCKGDADDSDQGGGTSSSTASETGATATDADDGASSGTSGIDTASTTDATSGSDAPAYDCDNPHPSWLLCEDFEAGAGDWDTWWAASDFISGSGTDDRGRVDLDSEHAHDGTWSVIMPAAASSGYQGAGLDWFACDGTMETNCPLRSFDSLYFRVWVRFDPDHRYVHHFLAIAGSQPDDFWYHGTAGCMPNGALAMGTTVDFTSPEHESFFYTYHLDMSCDTSCGNYADVDAICQECADKGLPTCDEQPQCCWGDNMAPDTPVVLPVGEWFCLEMMMQANTPGEHDARMAYFVDGQLGHEVEGLLFRTDPALALNRTRLQHYITSEDAEGFSNVVRFDDVVVSTEPIGCD